jgi:hypothetical protein
MGSERRMIMHHINSQSEKPPPSRIFYCIDDSWNVLPVNDFADRIDQGNTFDLLYPIFLILCTSLIYILEFSEHIHAHGFKIKCNAILVENCRQPDV